MLPTTTQDTTPAKMSNGPNTFDRFLSFVTTLLLTAIVVILAMLLVEAKKMTDREHGLVIRGASSNNLRVTMNNGASSAYPLYMKAII